MKKDIDLIREMCDVATPFGPEYDLERVIEAWNEREYQIKSQT